MNITEQDDEGRENDKNFFKIGSGLIIVFAAIVWPCSRIKTRRISYHLHVYTDLKNIYKFE